MRNGAFWDITAVLPGGAILARPARQGATSTAGGATVRLPAAYVREHVDLGYATTTARTQGMTVDQTHTIAAPGMGREDLYVAMSRGSDHNHVYVLTDTHDDDCLPRTGRPPTGRDILNQILATSHSELTATETWAAHHSGAAVPIPTIRAGLEREPIRSQHRLSHPTPASIHDSPVRGI